MDYFPIGLGRLALKSITAQRRFRDLNPIYETWIRLIFR